MRTTPGPAVAALVTSGEQWVAFVGVAIVLLVALSLVLVVYLRQTRPAPAAVESEARFRLSFLEAPVAMALARIEPDTPVRQLVVNHAMCELTGYSAEQLLGMRIRDLTHPLDLAESDALAREIIEGRRTRYHHDRRLVRADGEVVWVRMFAAMATGLDGRSYLVAHLEDITERRAAEATAAEATRDALTMLQGALLPNVVTAAPGVEVAAGYRTASATDEFIGGDWYDTIPLADGGLALVIGDVEGHDLTAATAMGLVRGAVRGAALEGYSPALVIERVNRFLLSSGIERLVTMAYVQLYPGDRTATVVLAGHPRPLLVRPADASARPLDVPYGLTMNVVAGGHWTEHTVLLPADAHLVLFTDGLLEPSELTEHHLDDVLAAAARTELESVEAVANMIIASAPRHDDVAVLVARATATNRPFATRTFPTLPLSAGSARTWIADLIAIWQELGLLPPGPETADREATAQLLVTELVSNAVRHSDRSVRVTVDVTDERLRVSVWDSSERMPVMRRREAAAIEGRGLRLVDTLSHQWGVDLVSDGKVVWFELSLAGQLEIDEAALLAAFDLEDGPAA